MLQAPDGHHTFKYTLGKRCRLYNADYILRFRLCASGISDVVVILIEFPRNSSFHRQPICYNYGFIQAWKQPTISFPLLYNMAFTEGMALMRSRNQIAPRLYINHEIKCDFKCIYSMSPLCQLENDRRNSLLL